jgi:P27 family predicted phage terminase small subunit
VRPGPLPKPAEIRKKDGTWRADRHPRPVMTPLLDELPDPPEELDDEGRRVWIAVGSGMITAGMLREGHLPMLVEFASASQLARAAFREMHKEGMVVPGSQGRGRVTNPWFKTWNSAVATMTRLGEHLGASPAAMTRLGVAAVRGVTLQQQLAALDAAHGAEVTAGGRESGDAV